MSRLPNAIGIGAAKAGTTWLFKCLQAHPQVFMAPCKETNFFSYGSIEGRFDEYLEHFRSAGEALAVGEVSTRYLAAASAAPRIKTYLPAARIFVSLRNPVDQVYSHYWHLRRQRFHEWNATELPSSIEEAVDRYPAKLLEPADYASHLDRWFEHFDRSRLHVILYDEIESDPRSVLRALYGHLGVQEDFVPDGIDAAGSDVRRGMSARSARFERTHAIVYRFLNMQVYHRLKALVGVRRATALKDSLRTRQVMERVFFRPGYPPMNAVTRRFLLERVQLDIDRLERLIGRSLATWQSAQARLS